MKRVGLLHQILQNNVNETIGKTTLLKSRIGVLEIYALENYNSKIKI